MSQSTVLPLVFTSNGAVDLDAKSLDQLDETQLRMLAQNLLQKVAQDSIQIQQHQIELQQHQAQINALNHEIRLLRHLRYGPKSEAINPAQLSLFEEAIEEDIAAAEAKLAELTTGQSSSKPRNQPKRKPLPDHLPRVDIHHEPAQTECGCGQAMERVSQDVSERLDYVPGTFRVERHIRGVWACRCCQAIQQQPMPAQIINGGIPTSSLMAQVVVSKCVDHMPLFRQSKTFARDGVELSVSTLADWYGACAVALAPLALALKLQLLQSGMLHADESPITVLGKKGQTQRGYVWAYATGVHDPIQAVVFELKEGRSGQHARDFLCLSPPRDGPWCTADPPGVPWSGYLLVDDYAGYKALFAASSAGTAAGGVTELGCWAHVRRKFHELHIASKSALAQTVLEHIGALYGLEREMKESGLSLTEVQLRREREAKPRLQALYEWLMATRSKVPHGTATAKAIDYAIKRWPALVRYCEDGSLPLDNNRIENLIRPWALGRKNWLFSGSLAAGQRAADIMSLLQTAKLNGLEPMAYLKDVLQRLPTHPYSRISELLPTHWKAPAAA
jgi:transposase